MASYLTLFERLILALIQSRQGPSLIGGIYSIIQPLVDGLKLLLKVKKKIINTNTYLFNFLFVLLLNLSLYIILFIPFNNKFILMSIEFNLIFIIILLLLTSIITILISWVSNNKLAILSNLRHFSILYSYSLSIIIIFFGIAFINGSFNILNLKLNQINISYILFCYFLFIWILIIFVNELKKIGFDIIESEGELAGGFTIEFSEINFALLILSEYTNFISFLFIILIIFFNNIYIIFIFIIILLLILRAILPNIRFDKVMLIFWKYIFILIFLINIFIIIILI